MRSRIIHLINPKTNSLTTRTQYMKSTLYSRSRACSQLPHAFRATNTKLCSPTRTLKPSTSI